MADTDTGTAEAVAPAAEGGESGAPARDGQQAFASFLALVGRGEIALSLGVVAILVVLILPMPPWALDLCLAVSITFAVIILMTSIFIEKPLDFSSFPAVLLIATILRLALNLASTRLILADGHEGTDAAGDVIEAFGSFVMGGNYVIGFIVFGILVIVNFVVITKGSGRIAEVAARFTLDAMPGKQMAIDADLSAGLIDDVEARDRRKSLEDEANFFGSMDGAAKFVRGDAIAGLLITGINVIGGIIIGVAQQDMSLGDAASAYTLLTVGDGLVTQIPAIIVSTAAGLVVTKTSERGSADKAIFGQFSAHPAALGLVSVLCGTLALLPGIPMVPFLVLAGATGGGAWLLGRGGLKLGEDAEAAGEEDAPAAPVAEEPISSALRIDLIRLELGYGLLPLVNAETGQKLTDQIKALRRQLAGDMGFVMPSVRIQDNLQLPANTYVLRVKEVETGRGDLRPGMLLVMDPRGEEISLPGEQTTEPTFGLPAMWIEESNREEAMFRGYTVVDAQTVITTHITEVIRENMPDLLSYAETQKLLDELDADDQKLVADLIPNQISVGGTQRVLQNLLRERISIRDLPTILEGISEACGHTRNVTMISEHVRSRLARQISNQHTTEQGFIPLLTLSPQWEQAFAESLTGQGEDRQLAMPPSQLQEFIGKVRQTLDRHAMMGEAPVLLCSPTARPYVRSIVERFRPQTVVMSQNEIHPSARIKTLGSI